MPPRVHGSTDSRNILSGLGRRLFAYCVSTVVGAPPPDENDTHSLPLCSFSLHPASSGPIMSGLLSRATNDSRFQFAATAVVSGGIVAAGLLSYQRLSREKRVTRLKESIPDPTEDQHLQKVSTYSPFPRTLGAPKSRPREWLITNSASSPPDSSRASGRSPPPTRKTSGRKPSPGGRRPATSTMSWSSSSWPGTAHS